jgi:hypothetical protein
LAVPDHIQQRDNIRAPGEILQDLDLPLDLLLLDRLEHLDHTLLVVDNIDAFEDLRVFPSSCAISSLALGSGPHVKVSEHRSLTDLAYHLIVLQDPPGDVYAVVVPV